VACEVAIHAFAGEFFSQRKASLDRTSQLMGTFGAINGTGTDVPQLSRQWYSTNFPFFLIYLTPALYRLVFAFAEVVE